MFLLLLKELKFIILLALCYIGEVCVRNVFTNVGQRQFNPAPRNCDRHIESIYHIQEGS